MKSRRHPSEGLLSAALILVLFAPAAHAGPADEVIAAMIEAHGGMEAWSKAPTVRFTDSWTFPGSDRTSGTTVTVEQGRRRAYLDDPATGAVIVWDGEKAWSKGWAQPTPPRFLALLNYFFLNLPWLARDPGVVLGEPKTESAGPEGKTYTMVMITYEPGVGDTPEDYYNLYIDPQSHRLAGCEYIVTYKALLPPGVKHTPPHDLFYEDYATVNGLLVPTRYTIYEEGKVYAKCAVADWSFTTPFDASRMTMPEGAVVDTSTP